MRLALIDLGTNAVRFDVVDVAKDGSVRRLHRERLAVRLGEGVFQTGRLSPAAMARTLAAFQSFRKTSQDLKVERVTAFGTSALRDSANSDIFLDVLKRKTGFEVRVISGREEARLIAQGILPHENKNEKGVIALVDIGGGSVEITLCRGRKILRSISLKLGVARLQQVFLKTVPPRPSGGENSPVDKLRRHARSLLAEGAPRGGWPEVTRIIGSAGTIRALDAIHRASGGKELTAKHLRRWAEKLAPLSREKVARVAGMDPKRVDTIMAGAIVLEEIVRAVNADRVIPTDFSLRDGMIEEERATVRRGVSTALEFHLKDLFERSCRWGLSPHHLRHVEKFARVLFNRLAPLHRLGPAWRDYLVAAAWLQDAGEWVSPVHHERHSYYMIKNGDFPGLGDWALEFVGQLVLWHKGGKLERKEIPFKDYTRRVAFFRLLSLLRIVDALEKPRAHWVTLRQVRRVRGAVRLALAGERSSVDLAVLRVEQKKELFEKTFRRSLSAYACR
jgi:exopolyphosphatase/guanosine-5'-triphosphate,3'-diphosphate pyrophosphatase